VGQQFRVQTFDGFTDLDEPNPDRIKHQPVRQVAA
jgi:hypothetical protein